VDENRLWFKAQTGLTAYETGRTVIRFLDKWPIEIYPQVNQNPLCDRKDIHQPNIPQAVRKP
jgi:hypothetical protein